MSTRIYPTATAIFGLDALDEKVSESTKRELVAHEIQEQLDAIIQPWKTSFESSSFNLNHVPAYGLSFPSPYMFGESERSAPWNTFMECTPFIQMKGTKYEKLLDIHHLIEATSDDRGLERLGMGEEGRFAEHPLPYAWNYYHDIDYDSYMRVIRCYQKAVEDGIQNACWCLGCALDLDRAMSKSEDIEGLAYYYLTEGILQGHLASFSALAKKLICDHSYEYAFKVTYVGAQRGDAFSLWNLAFFYLTGYYVQKSKEKALEIYDYILRITNYDCEENRTFIIQHYGSLSNPEVLRLIVLTHHNKAIVCSNETYWYKYYDQHMQHIYWDVSQQAIDEYMSLLEVPRNRHWYEDRVIELLTKYKNSIVRFE